MVFLLIVLALPTVTLLWWILAHRAARDLTGRWTLGLRIAVGAFAALHLTGLAVLIGGRMLEAPAPIPVPILVSTYVWYFFVVPFLLTPFVAWRAGVETLAWWQARRQPAPAEIEEPEEIAMEEEPEDFDPSPVLTRRQMLLGATLVAPPLINIVGTGNALAALDDFRVRELDVPVAGLPPALNGLRIAHLSDTHVGKFTNGAILDAIAERANALGADMMVVTGDIIDNSLTVLPETIRFLKRLWAPSGVWMCEGNHDLFESRETFEEGLKGAGLNLLVNESARVTVRGENVELIGLRWGGFGSRRNPDIRDNLRAALATSPADDAFRILLAHHPNAAEYAARKKIPLTLAGHTHGGQLMLTPSIGVGPLLFRYWSGFYRVGESSLVVSNGTGNWFPLRLNSPAEILLLTLRAA